MKNKNYTTIVLLITVVMAGTFLILKNIGDKPQNYDAKAYNSLITPSPTNDPIQDMEDLEKALDTARQINPDDLTTENDRLMNQLSEK